MTRQFLCPSDPSSGREVGVVSWLRLVPEWGRLDSVDEEPVSTHVVESGARRIGLAGYPVCVHASLRSFPRLEEGPATLVEGLLAAGATVMVATMANEAFSVPPPADDRPARNAIDYDEKDVLSRRSPVPGLSDIYSPDRSEVDAWLGATSAYVAGLPNRCRTRNSPEFCAVGPQADTLIGAEAPDDVYGPLRALARHSGWVLLAGVSLTSMTLLHLAEVQAGRRPFIRWLRGPDGAPRRVRGGECSLGFDRLAPVLSPVELTTTVGTSQWRAFPATGALDLAAAAVRADPSLTHCDNSGCVACADAIAGGPIER